MARNLTGFAPLLFQAGRPDMPSAFQFIQSVRAEAAKVTWPTRRETMITTGLVIVMAIVASIFFISVDWTIKLVLTLILGLAR